MKQFIVLGALILSVQGLAQSADNQSSNSWFGIMNGEGILTPLIKFETGNFSAPWTTNQKPDRDDSSIDVKVEELPKEWVGTEGQLPKDWSLYIGSKKSKNISIKNFKNLKRPPWYCAYWGLETSFAPPKLSNLDFKIISKRYLVTSGSVKVWNFVSIAKGSPDYKAIAKHIDSHASTKVAKAGPMPDGSVFHLLTANSTSKDKSVSTIKNEVFKLNSKGNAKSIYVSIAETYAEKDSQGISTPAVLEFDGKQYIVRESAQEGFTTYHLHEVASGGKEVFEASYTLGSCGKPGKSD